MLDVVFVLLLERLERHAALVAAWAAAGAEKPEDVPDLHDSLAEWLAAEPEQIDPERAELMAALGVGRG